MTAPTAEKAESVQSQGESVGIVDTRPLVPQPHGGAIRPGGKPGNRGGGRTPDRVKRRLAKVMDRRGVQFIDDVIAGKVKLVGICQECGHEQEIESDDDEITIDHRLKALDVAARHGLPTRTEIVVVSDEVRRRLEAQAAMLLELLPPELGATVVERLTEIWS